MILNAKSGICPEIVGTVDNHEILNKTAICFNSRGTNYRWSKGST